MAKGKTAETLSLPEMRGILASIARNQKNHASARLAAMKLAFEIEAKLVSLQDSDLVRRQLGLPARKALSPEVGAIPLGDAARLCEAWRLRAEAAGILRDRRLAGAGGPALGEAAQPDGQEPPSGQR